MTSPGGSPSRTEAAALLGVREGATAQEVQHAYLRAARRTHPDVIPEADTAGRHDANAAFDRLTRARDVLLADLPADPLERAGWSRRADDPTGPMFRPVPGRGMGGSLVVLALLAFLLIAIVGAQQALLGTGMVAPPPAVSTAP